MSIATANTHRGRIARYALAGAVALNIVTIAWAFFASTGTTIVAAVVLTLVGGATAANRWGRWWAEGRTGRGSIRGGR